MESREVIHGESEDGMPNYLQIFQIPRTNVAIEKTYSQLYNPLETFNPTDSSIKFRLNGQPDTCMDMKSIKLSYEFRVTKGNNHEM